MSFRWFCNPDSVRNVSEESVAVQLLVSLHRLRGSRPGHCVGRAAGFYLHLRLCWRPLPLCLPHSSRTHLAFILFILQFYSEILCQRFAKKVPTNYQHHLSHFHISASFVMVWLVPLPVVWNPQRLKQTLFKFLRQVGIYSAKETVTIINKRSQKATHSFSHGAEFVIIGQASYLWV